MELEDVLFKYATNTITEIKDLLKYYKLENSELYFRLGFKIEGNSLIFTFPDYSSYTEYGRGPGRMPPKAPIEDWMRRENIPLKYSFPIRKKIAETGSAIYRGEKNQRPFIYKVYENLDKLYLDLEKYGVQKFEENLQNSLSSIPNVEVKLS